MLKNKSIKKMNRVSRLINDIRSSSKHGDSLVVQTGFPTSLIDLFVKHRDRVNNSKKHNKKPSPPHPHPHPLVEEIRSTPDLHLHPHPLPLLVVDSHSDSNSYSIEVSGEKRRMVFMNVVKMFVILSFAFVTKRLAISVTFWAFLLLFLENWFKYHKDRQHFAKAETDTKELLQFDSEKQIEECKLADSDLSRERSEDEVEFVRMAGPNKMCRAKLKAKRFRKLVANKFRTNGGIEAKEQQSLIAPVQ